MVASEGAGCIYSVAWILAADEGRLLHPAGSNSNSKARAQGEGRGQASAGPVWQSVTD